VFQPEFVAVAFLTCLTKCDNFFELDASYLFAPFLLLLCSVNAIQLFKTPLDA
jgi:hypothetical protein